MADVKKTITIKINGEDAVVDLNEIKNALKETKEQADKVKDTNLKNFGNQIGDLKDKFLAGEIGAKGLAKGVLGVGKALLTAFITNPILLAITAIVGAIAGLISIFSKFEPLVEAVERAFAGLKAIWDTISRRVIDLATGNIKLKDTFKGLGDEMLETARKAYELKAAEQDLEDQTIALSVANSKLETEISKLIVQSKNKNLTDKERLALLDQITAKEKEQLANEKSLNDEAIRIAKERIMMNKNVKESDLDLSDARNIAALEQAGVTEDQIKELAALYNKEQEFTRGSVRIIEKAETEKENIKQAAADREKARKEKETAETEKEQAKQLKIIEDRYNNQKRLFDEEEKARAQKKARDDKAREEEKNKEKEWDDFQNAQMQKALERSDQKVEKELENQQKLLDKQREQEQAKIDAAYTALEAIRTMDDAITQMKINNLKKQGLSQEEYDKKVAEIEKQAAKRQKAYSIAEALINTALAITSALKVAPPAGIILAAAVGALGAAQVAAIMAQPIESTGGSTTTPSTSAANTGTAPNTSFTFADRRPGAPEIPPAKTYVISKDVNTQQQLDRQVIANGTMIFIGVMLLLI